MNKAAKILSENVAPVMDCICLSPDLIVWVHRCVIKLTLFPTEAILLKEMFFLYFCSLQLSVNIPEIGTRNVLKT